MLFLDSYDLRHTPASNHLPELELPDGAIHRGRDAWVPLFERAGLDRPTEEKIDSIERCIAGVRDSEDERVLTESTSTTLMPPSPHHHLIQDIRNTEGPTEFKPYKIPRKALSVMKLYFFLKVQEAVDNGYDADSVPGARYLTH